MLAGKRTMKNRFAGLEGGCAVVLKVWSGSPSEVPGLYDTANSVFSVSKRPCDIAID